MTIGAAQPVQPTKNAGAYPFVGNNYNQYGEIPGYIYYPWTDEYYVDPKQVEGYYEQQGIIEPEAKEPGLLGSLAPVVGTAAALYGGKAVGESVIKNGIGGTVDKVTGIFGSGSAAPAAVEAPGLIGGSVTQATAAAAPTLGAPNIVGAARVPVDAAAGASSPGLFSAQTPGTLGQVAGGLTAAKGAVDTYNSLQNGGEGIRGSATTLGAGVGGAVAGPVGAGLGALAGNALGYGLQGDGIKNKLALSALNPVLGAAKMLGFDPVRKTGQQLLQGRLGALAEQGVNIPGAEQRVGDYGASKDELVARAQQNIDAGLYGNTTFAQSRNEADLNPEDSWGGLNWFETFGNDYLNTTTEQQRYDLNQQALDEGLIREARGTLNWVNSDAEARAKELFSERAQGIQAQPGLISGGGVGGPGYKPDPSRPGQFIRI